MTAGNTSLEIDKAYHRSQIENIDRGSLLKISAREWFDDPEFRRWLNSKEKPAATWHKPGDEPGDFSDVFIYWDQGACSDYPDGLPKPIYSLLDDITEEYNFDAGVIWIKPT